MRHFFEQKKPVAQLCHAPLALISAGVLKGHGRRRVSGSGAGRSSRRRRICEFRGRSGWRDGFRKSVAGSSAFMREFIKILRAGRSDFSRRRSGSDVRKAAREDFLRFIVPRRRTVLNSAIPIGDFAVVRTQIVVKLISDRSIPLFLSNILPMDASKACVGESNAWRGRRDGE